MDSLSLFEDFFAMDGRPFLLKILFGIALFSSGVHAEKVTANACAWSCGKISATSKNARLKSQYAQVQSFIDGKSSCSLLENFNSADRNPRAGALQALAVAGHSCSISAQSNIKNKDFLFQAMQFQGLKLTQENKPFQKKDFEPSHLFNSIDKLSCLEQVSGSEPIRPGDIVLSKDDAVIVDTVDVDPFGIDARVRDPNRNKSLQAAETFSQTPDVSLIASRATALCADWVSDPAQFKISVFHAHGRAPFFPTYGKSTSPWVTAITERASKACFARVTEEISRHNGVAFPLRDTLISPPKPGMIVIRHHSEAQSCRVDRDQMPKSDDLDCVQCCDFSGKEEAL